MKQLIIQTNGHVCPIWIGSNALSHIHDCLPDGMRTHTVLLTDSNIPKRLVSTIRASLGGDSGVITIPAGESHKNLKTAQKIWKQLQKHGADRRSILVTIGGGVVSDIGGFAASTFMRGIGVIHVPTSVAAQADAAIGGKTAINIQGVKNLIGTVHQPIAVLIDTDTLKSLPKREFVSGFGEIIKHGLIRDESYANFVTSKEPTAFDSRQLEEIITRSCEIKSAIISSDEKEGSTRKLLNFGHTVGHALESLSLNSKMPLLHGEAVLHGMRVEARISELVGLIPPATRLRIERMLQTIPVPSLSRKITVPSMLQNIATDKKSEHGEVRWTLIQGIGKGIINQTVDHHVLSQALEEVLI